MGRARFEGLDRPRPDHQFTQFQKAMLRRTFLKGLTVTTVVVVGGRVFRALGDEIPSPFEGPAFGPWKDWQRPGGGPLGLVRAAILGASAVNTQPWLFKVTDSWIDLYADNRRNCGAFDPYLRELHISVGCALENLMLAAAAGGYNASATLAPGQLGTVAADAPPTKVARVELTAGVPERSALYEAIPHRHTNRAPFDALRPLPHAFVKALRSIYGGPSLCLFLFTLDDQRKRIAGVVADASGKLVADPQVLRDEMRWVRKDSRAAQESRDGVAAESVGASAGDAARQVNEAYPELLSTARLWGLIAVRDRYSREQSIQAGRVWQRAHLLATSCGVGGRPANQAVELIDQEKVRGGEPEQAKALAALTGDASWQPAFMFYMGYPTREAPPSVRRPVEEVVI
jgi:hypothetical protein